MWLTLNVWGKEGHDYEIMINMDLVSQIRPYGPDPNVSFIVYAEGDMRNVYVKHPPLELNHRVTGVATDLVPNYPQKKSVNANPDFGRRMAEARAAKKMVDSPIYPSSDDIREAEEVNLHNVNVDTNPVWIPRGTTSSAINQG